MVESRNLITSDKGQGTIEYILLLVITISMILLAMGNIFKPLGTFMKDYMGTYVACMLSSGELPGLKSENKLKEADPKCSFSFNLGKGSFSGNSSSGGNNSSTSDQNQNGSNGGQNGSGSQANKGSNNNKGSGGNNGNEDGSSGSSAGGRGSSSYAGSQSRRAMFGRPSMSSSESTENVDGSGRKKYINNLNRNPNDKFFRANSEVTARRANGRGIAISGFTEEMKKKQERKIQTESRVLPKREAEEFSKPDKKSILKPPPPVKKIEKTEDEQVGFGNYFKYILIIIIILLIVILGGGQMFEMSKSYD